MADGKIQLWQGKRLLAPDGRLAIAEDCCCGVANSCTACETPANEPVVTVSGSCVDEWTSTWAPGTYTFNSYGDLYAEWGWRGCEWVFTYTAHHDNGEWDEYWCLSLMYFADLEGNEALADTWWAAMYRCAFKEWCIYGYAEQFAVACGEGGSFDGTLTIPGNLGTDGEGCAVGVVL